MTYMQLDTDWMTPTQAAEYLGISRRTLTSYLEAGLPSHQPLGPGTRRFLNAKEIDEWLTNRCRTATRREAAS